MPWKSSLVFVAQHHYKINNRVEVDLTPDCGTTYISWVEVAVARGNAVRVEGESYQFPRIAPDDSAVTIAWVE